MKKDTEDMPKYLKILYNQGSIIIGAIAIAFSIYYTFANPQKESEETIAMLQAALKQHEAVQSTSDDALLQKLDLIQNGDIKDLKADLLENRAAIVDLQQTIVKLSTIIDERIPKK